MAEKKKTYSFKGFSVGETVKVTFNNEGLSPISFEGQIVCIDDLNQVYSLFSEPDENLIPFFVKVPNDYLQQLSDFLDGDLSAPMQGILIFTYEELKDLIEDPSDLWKHAPKMWKGKFLKLKPGEEYVNVSSCFIKSCDERTRIQDKIIEEIYKTGK